MPLSQRRGYAFHRPADFDAVRRMKERLCYVAADYQREVQVGGRVYLLTSEHQKLLPSCAPGLHQDLRALQTAIILHL